MGRRPSGHENPHGQRYCSECGQPIPPAAPDEQTEALHSQADETELQAAVQPPPVSSQEPSGKSRPASQPPTKQWYRKPRLVVPLSILAVVVAVAAVGFGAVLGGKSNSGATTQAPASTESPVSKKKQSPVSKWAAENQSKADRLAKSIKAAAAAGVAGPNTSARRSACQELGDASRAAADGLPAPNPALTDAFRAAIDDFDRAAEECMTGVERGDSAALGRFTSDLEAGQKQIAVAAYIVQGFNKRG
jgi:negative regulator of sigma E activity